MGSAHSVEGDCGLQSFVCCQVSDVMSNINKHLKELCGKKPATETNGDSSEESRSKTNVCSDKSLFRSPAVHIKMAHL